MKGGFGYARQVLRATLDLQVQKQKEARSRLRRSHSFLCTRETRGPKCERARTERLPAGHGGCVRWSDGTGPALSEYGTGPALSEDGTGPALSEDGTGPALSELRFRSQSSRGHCHAHIMAYLAAADPTA